MCSLYWIVDAMCIALLHPMTRPHPNNLLQVEPLNGPPTLSGRRLRVGHIHHGANALAPRGASARAAHWTSLWRPPIPGGLPAPDTRQMRRNSKIRRNRLIRRRRSRILCLRFSGMGARGHSAWCEWPSTITVHPSRLPSCSWFRPSRCASGSARGCCVPFPRQADIGDF